MNIEDVKKPTIWVLIGLPGSGKSTWIRNNANIIGDAAIVSSDDFIEAKGAEDGLNYSQAFDKHIGAAVAHSKETFRNAVKNNKNIVIDQTNMGKKKRMSWLSQVGNKYHKVAVSFDVPETELMKRLKARADETGKHIPSHVVDQMAKNYNPPTKEEGFDKIIYMKS
jgi:predicted kinase